MLFIIKCLLGFQQRFTVDDLWITFQAFIVYIFSTFHTQLIESLLSGLNCSEFASYSYSLRLS
jgi:hypothetical protein